MYTNSGELKSTLPIAYACMIGSLFPDIDSTTSKISKNAKVISRAANIIFGHRGFIHTPLCAVIIGSLIYSILKYFGLPLSISYGFFWGYLGHLTQDTFTKMGISWFFPVYMKKISFRKRRTTCSPFLDKVITILIIICFVELFQKVVT